MSTSEAASTSATVIRALLGIQHVGLTVTDIESSCEWYQRVLGLVRQFEEPHHRSDRGGYAVVLGTADMSLNLGLDHHPGNSGETFDATRTGLDHLCFQVASVEALNDWAVHLDEEGIAHSGIYAMDGMPISLLTFHDPDGIQLELLAIQGS